MIIDNQYKIIVIGASAGGLTALTRLLSPLPGDFPFSIIIVQHLHPLQGDYLNEYFNDKCYLTVKEANEKETIEPKNIYFAPPNYHLLIEEDKTFSLSIDEKVNFSRPSIDVLFESAADVYAPDLIGIVLTGANNDGARGLKKIKENGGLAIAQDPSTAEQPEMPRAAIDMVETDYILPLEGITDLLIKMSKKKSVACS